MGRITDKDISEDKKIQITAPKDCGKSPKKLLLKEFTMAFVSGQMDFLMARLEDLIVWNVAGDEEIHGKVNFAEKVNEIIKDIPAELSIKNIITYGSTAAADAIIIFSAKRSYALCNVFNFNSAGKNAKIKEMTSYIIEIKKV